MMYKIVELPNPYGDPYQVIQMTDVNGAVWTIPEDESNSDYQAYLAWKVEQEK